MEYQTSFYQDCGCRQFAEGDEYTPQEWENIPPGKYKIVHVLSVPAENPNPLSQGENIVTLTLEERQSDD